MVLVSALLGLIVGLLAHGSFGSILHKRFRQVWLLFLSIACELFVASGLMSRWLLPFAVVQYGTLTLFLLFNFRKPGLRIVLLGSLLNAAAILANGGRMPVGAALGRHLDSAALQAAIDRITASPNYFYAPSGAPLLFLADILPVRLLSAYMISVGDIFLSFGLFLFAWYLVRRPRRIRPSLNTRRAL